MISGASLRVVADRPLRQSGGEPRTFNSGADEQVHEIFISYRHTDSAGHVDRLHDALVAKYGKDAVFMDQTLEAGGDFPDEIRQAAKNATIGLVIIGTEWVRIEDDDGNRRLDNEGDWVVEEVDLLLDNVPHVVPLLIDGAKPLTREDLPAAIGKLADKEVAGLSRKGWNNEIKSLVHKMDRWLRRGRTRPRVYRGAFLSALVTLFVMLVVWWTQFLNVVPGYLSTRAALDKWTWAWAGPPFRGDGVALIRDSAPAEGTEPDRATRLLRRLDHALLIEALSEAQAGVVVFDYVFNLSIAEVDEKLADAIAGSASPVVVGATVDRAESRGVITEALREAAGDRWGLIDPRYNAVAGHLPGLEIARLQHDPELVRSGAIWPALPLRAVMLHIGATRAVFDHGSESVRLAAESGESLAEIPVIFKTAASNDETLGPPAERTASELPALLMAVQLGDDLAIEEHGYDEILAELRAGDPHVLEDLKRDFAGRIVVVGSTSEKRVPEELGGGFGHEVQAQVVANLLRGRYARKSRAAGALGIVVAVLLGVAWRLRPGRPEEIVESRSPYRHWVLACLDLLGGTLVVAILALLVALPVFRFTVVSLPVLYWLSAFALTYFLVTVAERRKFSS